MLPYCTTRGEIARVLSEGAKVAIDTDFKITIKIDAAIILSIVTSAISSRPQGERCLIQLALHLYHANDKLFVSRKPNSCPGRSGRQDY